MDDREEVVRRVAGSLGPTIEKLRKLGCSDLEVGKGMLAAGVAVWVGAVGVEDTTFQLAAMVRKMAEEINASIDTRTVKH